MLVLPVTVCPADPSLKLFLFFGTWNFLGRLNLQDKKEHTSAILGKQNLTLGDRKSFIFINTHVCRMCSWR